MTGLNHRAFGARAPVTTDGETVSVVIPTYNYGRFVVDAVDCALQQTWGNLEVIVVDDGSTDDTRERLAPYLDRIQYVHQPNRGLSAARNTGIRHARGEWIALLDADDLWHPQKIERQLSIAGIDASIGFVGSPECSEMPDLLPDRPATREVGVRDFFFGTPMTGSSTLVRRSALALAGVFDETLTSVEDRDMWLRLAASTRGIQVVTPCWQYRIHPGQMSRTAQRMLDNYSVVLTSFFAANPSYSNDRRSAFAFMYLDAAHCFFNEGRRVTALRYLLSSWWQRPWSVRVGDTEEITLRCKLAMKFIWGTRLFSALRRTAASAEGRTT